MLVQTSWKVLGCEPYRMGRFDTSLIVGAPVRNHMLAGSFSLSLLRCDTHTAPLPHFTRRDPWRWPSISPGFPGRNRSFPFSKCAPKTRNALVHSLSSVPWLVRKQAWAPGDESDIRIWQAISSAGISQLIERSTLVMFERRVPRTCGLL